jgi:hypothetical protein
LIFRSADWDPLLAALKVNRNLKIIAVHSSYISPDENESNEAGGGRATLKMGYARLKKPPSIRNKERTNKLCRSLKDCLSVSTFLNQIDVFNLPLTTKDCTQIAKVIFFYFRLFIIG